jgi:hypothetical protein
MGRDDSVKGCGENFTRPRATACPECTAYLSDSVSISTHKTMQESWPFCNLPSIFYSSIQPFKMTPTPTKQ